MFPRVIKTDVKKVQDGDTLNLPTGEKIRFFGIDAPETYPRAQLYGREAKNRVIELIKESGGSVHLLAVDGGSNSDKYGRLIRVVFVRKNIDLNLLLIKEGLAWAYRKYLKGTAFEKSYIEAEEEARREKRGLWSANISPINPEDFRNANKHRKK